MLNLTKNKYFFIIFKIETMFFLAKQIKKKYFYKIEKDLYINIILKK